VVGEALAPALADSLEADAQRIAGGLERRKWLIISALTAVYFAGAILHARGKPFWFDEIVTVVAARSPDIATTWRVARQVDANPPLPHILSHLSLRLPGPAEVTARLPAMVGFWIFCLCLSRFVKRRAGIFFGLAALLLPVATDAYSYSVEARAYGLELAFCGLALVGGQSASEGIRRRIWLPTMAFALAAAFFCHYYSVLVYIPLAGAELLRSRGSRRVDFAMWLALGAGLVPAALLLSTIRGVVQGFTHTWAPPYPEQMLEFWEQGLQHSLSFLMVFLVVGAWMAANHPKAFAKGGAAVEVPGHEWAAAALFAVIPVFAVTGALLVTHMFTPRYAIVALAGFCLLALLLAAHFTGGRALAGFLLLAASLLPLGFATLNAPTFRDPFDQEPALKQALERGPVVVPDGHLFLQMWYYAPEQWKSKLIFLADKEAAVKYMGFDTIDDGIPVLRPWAAMDVRQFRDFEPAGGEFTVYQNTLRPGWVMQKILDEGGSARVESYSGFRQTARMVIKSGSY
jgi:hypothetical protein